MRKSTLSNPVSEGVRVLYLYPSKRGFVHFKGIYSPERKMIMITDKTTTTTARTEQPDLVKTIGRTTYRVRVYFSKTSKETITDKIFRLLRNEVSQSPKM